MVNTEKIAYKAALQWYLDHGVDEALGAEPLDATKHAISKTIDMPPIAAENKDHSKEETQQRKGVSVSVAPVSLGKSEAYANSVKLAQEADSIEDLQRIIAEFDGITLKKTATNMVFSAGNPKADIMLVGEAPGADEDRQGQPFVGVEGQLLDLILSHIGLSRKAEEPEQSIYISNVLNWRPPGNRTPAPAEIDVSLPFIERHIQLVKPKILLMCGGVSAKSLLGTTEGISRLRGKWHDYMPQTPELRDGVEPIVARAIFHPAYLLRTPARKKAMWADMLDIKAKRKELGIL